MMQPFDSSVQPWNYELYIIPVNALVVVSSDPPLHEIPEPPSASGLFLTHGCHAFPWFRPRRAPAGHLCLKTNLPWVAFEEPSAAAAGGDEASASGGGATGGAVGASGTTLVPPVGVIMPGEGCV